MPNSTKLLMPFEIEIKFDLEDFGRNIKASWLTLLIKIDVHVERRFIIRRALPAAEVPTNQDPEIAVNGKNLLRINQII